MTFPCFELYRMHANRYLLRQKIVAQGRIRHPLRCRRHPAHSARPRTGAPRNKKQHTKRCLRAVKTRWRWFQQLVADTKYFQDIPYYWPQMRALELPSFQYTVCQPVSGLCLTGYADERSNNYAMLLCRNPAGAGDNGRGR